MYQYNVYRAGKAHRVEWRYSSTHSQPWRIKGVVGERHTPAASPILKEACSASGPFWTGTGKSRPYWGLKPRTVQFVAGRHTDCALLADIYKYSFIYLFIYSVIYHITSVTSGQCYPIFTQCIL